MLNAFTSRTCIVLFLCLLASSIYAQVGVNLEDQVYAGPVRGATGIVFDRNGNLYTHDVYGAVYRVKRGESTPTLWLDIREEVGNYGDHGLLGMALDRDFLENGRFYLYYNVDMYWYKNVGKPGYDKNRSLENYPSFGRLTRYTAHVHADFSVDLNSRKVLIGETHDTGVPVLTLSHLGGGLTTGTDGTILIGTGDGSSFEQVDTGCNSTTWVDLAMQEGIIKYIPNPGTTTPESCSKPGYYDKSRVTENIGAYRAQALFSLSGKILRIDPETGDGLPSNPFYNASLGPRAAQNRVYALGLRQAFRISVRPGSGSTNPQEGKPGVIYIGDVGFSNWEELNVVTQPGQNFGWPYYEGILKGREGYWKTKAFEPTSPVKPRVQWRDNKYTEIVQGETVTNLNKTVLEGGCVIGGAWHEGGGNYPVELQNTYYFADYNAGWIAGMRFGHDNEPEVNSLFKTTKKIVTDAGGQRLTHVAFNPYDRNMYYITFGEAGVIRRFVVSTDQPPVAAITQDNFFGNSPLAITFSAKESYDPEGKPLKYEWNVSDGTKSTAMNYTRTFTSATPKSYTISLKVTDEQNKTNSTQTVVSVNNTPPTIQSTSVDNLNQITISSPYTIHLNATATDAESPGQLSYRWTIYLYHNDHRHVVTTVANQTGSVTVSEGSCDGTASYWYGVVLDVTDANGLSTTYTKFLYLDCPGASQTIDFASISDRLPTDPPFNPHVSATSNLPISLFAIEGPAFISNGQINLTGGIGRVTIRATQHGNSSFRYAQPIERSFIVTKNVTPTPNNQAPVAPATFTLSATINVVYNSGALAIFTDSNPLTYSLTGLPNGLNFNPESRVISGTPNQQGTHHLTYSATDGSLKTDLAVTLTVITGGTPVLTGSFEGYLDQVNCNTFSGWVWNRDKPNTPVNVEFLDGTTTTTAISVGSTLADIFRDDLKNAGKGNGAHGYNLVVPENLKNNQTHTIWGRVQGSEFILKWAPKTINCAGSGIPPANLPPTPPAVSSLSAFVNTNFTSAALAAFSDPESTPLTYELLGLPQNLTFNASTRVVNGTPATTGTFSLTYTATDLPGAKTSVVFSLIVSESNNPPANVPPAAPTVSPLSATVNAAYSTTLPAFTDTDPLSYTLTGLPSGLGFNAGTRVISGTPTQQGTFPLTYAANDGKVTESIPISLAVAAGTGNPPPVVTGSFEGYLDVVNCSTFSGWIWDRDKPNTPITIEFMDGATLPGSTVIDQTVANIFRQDLKNANKGNGAHGYSFVVPERLKDNQTHTIWARVVGSEFILKWAPKTITCVGTGTPPANAAPVVPAVSPLSATMNVGFTASALPVFTDAENDALTYTLTGLPGNLSFDATTRVISGTPIQQGTFTLTYSAKDSQHAPVPTTLTLTVNPGGGTPGPPPTSGNSGPGNYEGYLDIVNCNSIQGWIWNRDKPNLPITVEFLNGTIIIGNIDANIYRDDLKNAGKGNGVHGYNFSVPISLKDGKTHSISGRVPGSNYILKWSPKSLTCPTGSRQGIDEKVEISMELNISPNPSRGSVEISYRIEADQRANLQVVDVLGRQVWKKTVIGTGKVEYEIVNLSSAGPYLYLIQLKTALQMISKRLLINR